MTFVRGRLTRAAGAMAIALGGTGCLAGCYTFAPVTPASLAEAGEVRVRLTGEGANALAPALGTGVTGLEGTLVRRATDTLVVRPTTLNAAGGVDVTWTGADVAIPVGWTSSVERRRLSTTRTALFIGGGVVAAAIVVDLARGGGSHGGDPSITGPINLSRGPR